MGQKINAHIFRLGIKNKNWNYKYIEKNIEESSLFLYKTLEIKKYLNRFFGLYKIKIKNCKILYSTDSLQLFIPFYISTKTIFSFKNIKRKDLTNNSNSQQTQNNPPFNISIKLLESLRAYTGKKMNIFITFQNLNENKSFSVKQSKETKTIIKRLKKFANRSFFKEIMNILFVNCSRRNSAKLLSEFLQEQFKLNQLKTDQLAISKKDNYFIGFLRQVLKLLIISKITHITGIKIVIKGRFNKAPRAKTVIIQFGKFSLQSIDSKINYHQSTAYTLNGTFGIKIWICEN